MTMATIAVVVCNKCEELGKPTRSYTIKQGRRQATVDLCEEDSAYLEQFLNGKPRGADVTELPVKKVAGAKRVASGRRGRVVSMDDIEALKKG